VKVSDFDYDLPPGRIAQEPAARRDGSRLLVLDRPSGHVDHRRFADLPDLLDPADLVVLNDTRVLPARLTGRKPTGGRVEILLLDRIDAAGGSSRWWCWLRASKTPGPGSRVDLGHGLTARLEERDGDRWRVTLEDTDGDPDARIELLGRPPLPPYIRRGPGDPRDSEDRRRYQTVYARRPGAVAAPTAGLHFSNETLERLESRGVRRAYVTLHVGLGTFQPVRVDEVENHPIHAEAYEVTQAAASAIAETRSRGGRIVAVGTTVTRVLEHRAAISGVTPGSGRCDLFIYPGFAFRVVDVLLTNFHLPRSTLVMLVSAFAGRERILAAYREAIEREYRFYSYGDAMVIGSFR
jgi:S-adenosylmethionine:tRNA ribosyltransferase-isomerase